MPDADKANTILIVDDKKRLRKGLARSLGQEHFRTLTAASGEEALRLLKKTPVSLVITDLVMPGMDGMTLVREMRKSKLAAEVIIITAYGSAESKKEAKELGVAHYLAKPFDLPDLKSKVKELLAGKPKGASGKTKRNAPSTPPPLAGAKYHGAGRALRNARLGGAKALKALTAFPREAVKRMKPGNLVRTGAKALKATVDMSKRIVPYFSPRNMLTGLGKVARAISGLASAFRK